MNETQFKVIGTWGDQGIHEHVLGTFDTLKDAMNRVDTWQDDPIYKYSAFVTIEVVKVTESTVWFAKDQSEQDNNLSESSRLSPSAAADPDYERVGVPPSTGRFEGIRTQEISPAFAGTRKRTQPQPDEQVRDTFQPFDDLQETVWNLEDRHVGLRAELGADIDHVYEHIDELREQLSSATAEIDNLDQEMRREVAGLRREMEALRSELQREPAIRRHAEWERQQQKNKEVSER